MVFMLLTPKKKFTFIFGNSLNVGAPGYASTKCILLRRVHLAKRLVHKKASGSLPSLWLGKTYAAGSEVRRCLAVATGSRVLLLAHDPVPFRGGVARTVFRRVTTSFLLAKRWGCRAETLENRPQRLRMFSR